jgi:hypothetical protein
MKNRSKMRHFPLARIYPRSSFSLLGNLTGNGGLSVTFIKTHRYHKHWKRYWMEGSAFYGGVLLLGI